MNEIECKACHSHYFLKPHEEEPKYCPFCGVSLNQELSSEFDGESEISLVAGLTPSSKEIKFKMGPYQIINTIGKGGMGEVLLAYDTGCGRRIALKRIRTDLKTRKQLYSRFLKEARITSQLTHPGIIPIYAIHDEPERLYYTMPYVKGSTLKQILNLTRKQEKKEEELDHLGGSIPALARVFIQICQAISYSHSQNVLHRDIKPENVMIGEYGEVMILDWGLAKLVKTTERRYEPAEPKSEKQTIHELTRLGKVVGTVAFMAPERALGNPATIQTDIYSLGVLLYQILTLHLPFRRGKLEDFRKTMAREVFTPPSKVAPYREVPPMLEAICRRCIEPDPRDRYDNVQDLIRDLENYIEGRSEWFEVALLDLANRDDWEFQANVFLAEHMAITRRANVVDWVNLMISKQSFSSNVKINARVKVGESGHGIGFLLSIPEEAERSHLNDGYCLWIGSDTHRSTKLLKSTIEVYSNPELCLERGKWYRITLEKIDNTLHFYLNGEKQFTYQNYIPLIGTHIGIISRDDDYELFPLSVSQGNLHVTVNCLAVPDAFLAHKDYQMALAEYRRIAYSFPGRAEGREAQFRAGVTLLEQGRHTEDSAEAKKLYDQALEEFEKLHETAGAPLEYLGKGLVYQFMDEWEEEIKCYSLGLRRYKKHPLLAYLHEHLVNRMHEYARCNRPATYSLILLSVQHCPGIREAEHSRKLFNNLQENWEPLPFLIEDPSASPDIPFKIALCFWLGKPFLLQEIAEQLLDQEELLCISFGNAIFSMIKLGFWDRAKETLENLQADDVQACSEIIDALIPCIMAFEEEPSKAADELLKLPITANTQRAANFVGREALDRGDPDTTLRLTELFPNDTSKAWAYLLKKEWDLAGSVLHSHPLEELCSEESPLHFLYGCYLLVREGKEIADAHFSGVIDATYPRSWSLATHHLRGKIATVGRWEQMSFPFEKKQLSFQLELYQHCLGAAN